MKKSYSIINLRNIQNEEKDLGGLTFVEELNDIPFGIKRIYSIYGTKAEKRRGFHSHKSNWQLLFCPYGCIELILDDGYEKNVVVLDKPYTGLIIPPNYWREIVWKQDNSVLMVAASEMYDPDEYIRDYDEFMTYIQNNA